MTGGPRHGEGQVVTAKLFKPRGHSDAPVSSDRRCYLICALCVGALEVDQ